MRTKENKIGIGTKLRKEKKNFGNTSCYSLSLCSLLFSMSLGLGKKNMVTQF